MINNNSFLEKNKLNEPNSNTYMELSNNIFNEKNNLFDKNTDIYDFND
jgi:hypothetical protein